MKLARTVSDVAALESLANQLKNTNTKKKKDRCVQIACYSAYRVTPCDNSSDRPTESFGVDLC